MHVHWQLEQIRAENKAHDLDVERILADTLAPIGGDEATRVDYRLFTGSTWNAWEQKLEDLLDGIEWIAGGAMYLNADWHRRTLALAEARKHEGYWPHHFLVTHIDSSGCEPDVTQCERCGLNDRYLSDQIEKTACVLSRANHYPFPFDPEEEIPF